MRHHHLLRPRHALAALGCGALVTLAACGGSTGSSSEVASLGTDAPGSETASTDPVDTQQQWLDFAQCMRDNGVAMDDPTFDADGNLQGGGFGPDSGIDLRSEEARTAMDACGDALPASGPGGGAGPDFDVTAIQDAMNSVTECLRDNGLDVDDIEFGAGPGGGPGGDGTPPTGDLPQPPTSDGGFQGGPPADGGAPGGEGFDPMTRLLEQLGLDQEDAAVQAALDACSVEVDAVTSAQPGQPGSSDTTGTDS